MSCDFSGCTVQLVWAPSHLTGHAASSAATHVGDAVSRVRNPEQDTSVNCILVPIRPVRYVRVRKSRHLS
jgi:hypothetical protein